MGIGGVALDYLGSGKNNFSPEGEKMPFSQGARLRHSGLCRKERNAARIGIVAPEGEVVFTRTLARQATGPVAPPGE